MTGPEDGTATLTKHSPCGLQDRQGPHEGTEGGEVTVTIVTALKVALGMTLADLFSGLEGNREGTPGG